jgi:WD40 repeat protein
MILGTAVATWQAVAATRARNEATLQRSVALAARDAERLARQQADATRAQAVHLLASSERLTCRLTCERGQALCEQGQIDLGMLWLVRALELTSADSADLERVIRVSLNAWAMHLNTIEAVFPWTWGVSGIALSPDGRTVIASYRFGQGTVRFWDAFTGKEKDPPIVLAANSRGAAPGVNQAIFSQNGRLIATASDDRTARIWEVATRQPLGPNMLHDDPVVGVSFDPEAKILATAAGRQIHFWNVASGKREDQRLTVTLDVEGVAYSPDGKRMAAWAGDTAWLWDAATRKSVGTPMKHAQRVWTAAFSPDSTRLLTNEEDETRFWDAATGQPVGTAYSWKNRMGSMAYGRVSFRADGRLLATAGFPPRLWDLTTGKNTNGSNTLLEGHFVAMSPDGKSLVTARREGSFVRLELAPGLAPLHTFPISETAWYVLPSPDEVTCVTAGEDHDGPAYRIWNIQTGRQLGTRIALGDVERIPRPVFSPDSRTLAVRSGRSACQLWDVPTGRHHGPVLEHHQMVCAMAISPDNRKLASGDADGVIRFWNVSTGEPMGPPLKHRRAVTLLKFSPDGRKLLAAGGKLGGQEGEARLWDVASREPLGPVLDHMGELNDAAFRPDGKVFLTASFQLRSWNTATSKEIEPTFTTRSVVAQVAFSPDSKTILARLVGGDDVARIFDSVTGKPIGSALRHQSQVAQSWFSPDGMLVLTASDDRTARLWDAATGLPIGPPWKNDRATPFGRFVDDGRSILIVGDRSIDRWPVPTPMEGTRERIRLAVEVATRHTLDSDFEIGGLTSVWSGTAKDPSKPAVTKDPWRAVRERLLELGGPPGNLRR